MGPIRTNMSPGSSIRIPPSGTPSDSWGISSGSSRGPSSRIYRRMYCLHFSLVNVFRCNSSASSTNVLPLPSDSSVGASGKTMTSRGNAACSTPTMWLKMLHLGHEFGRGLERCRCIVPKHIAWSSQVSAKTSSRAKYLGAHQNHGAHSNQRVTREFDSDTTLRHALGFVGYLVWQQASAFIRAATGRRGDGGRQDASSTWSD